MLLVSSFMKIPVLKPLGNQVILKDEKDALMHHEGLKGY